MYLPTSVLYFICIATLAQTPTKEAGRIYISKDQGVRWERADSELPEGAAVNAWIVKNEMVLAGTNAHGIFISSDQLKSWYPSSKGLPKNTRIISMASYRNTLFAGTYTDGIFSSDDDGERWHLSSTGLKNFTIRCFYTDGPLLLAGTNDGIYSSTDEGKSWTLEKSGLQINVFLSANMQILAATNKGVLASTGYGKTWDWVFKEGAIHTMAVREKEIYLMDFFGTVYRSASTYFIWLKTDLYLPFRYTFQLTPASSQFLIAEWKEAFKNLNEINSTFRSSGLPEGSAFTELLNTPFGLLAAAASPKKIE